MAYIDKATGLIVPGGEPCDTDASGGSGPDLSGLTVKASDVSQGVTYYGSSGRGTGTMPDVSVSISGRNVSVPAGRIRTSQSLAVSAGGVSITGDKVNVSAGYVGSQTLNVPAGGVSLAGNKVNVSAGYVGSQTLTVSGGSVAVNGGTVNVSAGYVESQTLKVPAGGVSIAGDKVNVSAGYVGTSSLVVPAGSVAVNGGTVNVSAGYVENQTLKVPSGVVSIAGDKVNVSAGYVNTQSLTVPAGSVALAGDKVVVSAGYVGAQEIEVPANGPDLSGLTVDASDVSEGVTFCGSNGIATGTMPDVEVSISGRNVSVPAGRIRTSQALAVSAGNVALDGAVVRVTEGYVASKTLEVPAGGVSIDGGTVNVSAGYVESQTLNVSAGGVSIAGDKVNVSAGYVASGSLNIPAGELNIYDNYVVLGGGYYAARDFLIGNTVNGYTVFPNDREQKISSGSYLTGDVVVMGDSNLIPANIVLGKSIFGVEGSAKPGADTSDANTVTAADVSENLVFYNAAGRQVGTMPDVAVSISGPDVTVPAGRIRTSQSLSVSAGNVALDGAVVRVTEGYVASKTLEVPAGSVSVNKNYVNVSAGYLNEQEVEVNAGSVEYEYRMRKVVVVEGYVDGNLIEVPLGEAFLCKEVYPLNEHGYGTWLGCRAAFDEDRRTYDFPDENDDLCAWYSDGFKPEVGKIYNFDATAIIEELWGVPKAEEKEGFYQCAEVFGPEKVSGFIVSGAGTAAVNGNYLPTELRTEEDTPIYKHETAEYYYFEMWGEKGICTSPTDYPGNGLYYNMYDEGWAVGSGGAEPVPTVTAGNITINADVPKTWNGYKAVWHDTDGYSFEETLTEGLTYGSALTPNPGSIYDSNARMEVSKLFEAVKPITTNDTSCLIYIDGTSLTNQALSPTKHEVTFGSGVSLLNGYVNMTNDETGQILTTARADGYGGNLKEWTWDYYFLTDADSLDCSGHSVYGWCLEGNPGAEMYFRGQGAAGQKLGVIRQKNEIVGLSMQYDNGVLHVWDKGKYIGICSPSFPNCAGQSFGIGCIADGDYDRMADNIKLFRFSNKARYTPGVDFELPEGFL
jgi:hypothetical protein